jgi:hypothetical protein
LLLTLRLFLGLVVEIGVIIPIVIVALGIHPVVAVIILVVIVALALLFVEARASVA